jgi:hypothetical protein
MWDRASALISVFWSIFSRSGTTLANLSEGPANLGGSPMLWLLWLSVFAYLILQFAVLMRGHSWLLAASPLLYMLPIMVLTIQAAVERSNMWPIFLLLAGPVALIHVGLVALSQHWLGSGRSHAARQ